MSPMGGKQTIRSHEVLRVACDARPACGDDGAHAGARQQKSEGARSRGSDRASSVRAIEMALAAELPSMYRP
jgi:hypothetical protein